MTLTDDFTAAKARAATWEPAPMPPEWDEVIPTQAERRPTRITGEVPADDLWKQRRKWDRRSRTWAWVPMALLILFASLTVTINDAEAHQSTPAAAASCPRLQYGSTGQAVSELQYRLRANGWVLAVDGKFGPRTQSVVTSFQRMSGLHVDGIVGPQTQRALKCGVTVDVGTPPVPAPGGDAVGRWREVALSAGWSDAEWPWLSCVINRESKGDQTAYNGRGNDRSYGLTQLNTKGSLWSWFVKQGLTSPQQLLDGYTNLRIAKIMYNQFGKNPWRSSSKPC